MLFFYKKLRVSSGQSILEYCAIAMFVVMGILGMGPHVIRAVNAYFKTAETQARDSFREDLRQTALVGNELNYDLGECNCSMDTTTLRCGDGQWCEKNQKMADMSCSTAACEEVYQRAGFAMVQCDDEAAPTTSFVGCYPGCDDLGDKENCPLSENLFNAAVRSGSCGWTCCLDKEPVLPLQCGKTAGTTKGKALMKKRCGPNLVNEYFWETSSYCSIDCPSGHDAFSDWCDEATHNYGVTPTTQTTYVEYGGCEEAALASGCDPADPGYDACASQVWQCMVECPNQPHVRGGTMGCECEGVWTYLNGFCQCLNPNKDLEGDGRCWAPVNKWYPIDQPCSYPESTVLPHEETSLMDLNYPAEATDVKMILAQTYSDDQVDVYINDVLVYAEPPLYPRCFSNIPNHFRNPNIDLTSYLNPTGNIIKVVTKEYCDVNIPNGCAKVTIWYTMDQ